MSRVPSAALSRQHAPLREELLAGIAEVLDGGAFCLGPWVERFEKEWAAYLGVAHAVGMQSGTAALMAALEAVGVGPGDEVVTAANTFVATVGAIHFLGARPVLVDVEPDSANMDPECLAGALTDRTRAVVPVHLYGRAAAMTPILELCSRRGIPVVDDASQAHGTRHPLGNAGTLGAAGCFSFYPGKNLGALGEGGALVTDDPEIAARARRFRNHGGEARYEHLQPGLNLRMEGFQGAALSVKLPHLDGWNRRRREVARRYDEALAGLPLELPAIDVEGEQVFHLYVLRSDERDALLEHLVALGVDARIHYPAPVHLVPAYRHLEKGPGSYPVAERLANRILSLPMFSEITDDEVDAVIEAVRSFHA